MSLRAHIFNPSRLVLLSLLALILLDSLLILSGTVLYDQGLVATNGLKIYLLLQSYLSMDQLHQPEILQLLSSALPLQLRSNLFLVGLDAGQSDCVFQML